MDMKELARLKELAQKATPGPWDTGASRHDPSWVVLRETGFQIADCPICVNGFNNAAYIAAISPDVLLALIKENEQLRHEKDFYTRAMADYLQVAKMAWGGEIPSPLPGHISSEEKMIEQFEYLNCPCCGGSGHVGDCSVAIQNMKCELANIQADAENLKKEADWLAKNGHGEDQCPYFAFYRDSSEDVRPEWCECLDNGEEFDCDQYAPDCWRKAARKAVKDETNV